MDYMAVATEVLEGLGSLLSFVVIWVATVGLVGFVIRVIVDALRSR